MQLPAKVCTSAVLANAINDHVDDALIRSKTETHTHTLTLTLKVNFFLHRDLWQLLAKHQWTLVDRPTERKILEEEIGKRLNEASRQAAKNFRSRDAEHRMVNWLKQHKF